MRLEKKKNKYSNFIEANVQGEVILDFTTYISANNEIKIRGVDVKRFGVDSSPNHSNVDKKYFFIDKNNPLGQLFKKNIIV